MRKKNGFTLVELLSTIVILGIVFSIAVYLVVKNINKTKDDAMLINYTNIKNAAKVYTDEVSSYWNVKDDYEYSCISLGNMIEIGYFDEKVISDKLTKNTKIKVIRDKDSKVIKETSFSFEDSILPDVDCGYQSSVAISTDNKGKKVKTTNAKIIFNGLNEEYYRYFKLSGFSVNITTSDVVYACGGIGNCSNDTVSNLESGKWYLAGSDVIRLNVKTNGIISAFINYNGENVAEATKNIDFIDNTPPVISLRVYKIGSYDGNTPKTKGDLITTISGNYVDNEWKNYGYWFDISTNEDTVIKWTYNNTGSVNGGSPSNSGANCNNSCSKTLSGDGNRKATIVATDEAGNSSKIDVSIYIDRTAPTIKVSEQRCSNKDNCLGSLIGNKIEKSTNTSISIDDKNWSYNSFNIKYNASDSMSDIKEIRILQNSSGIYNQLNTNMVSNNIVSNNSNLTISDTGQRYIQVVAYDNVGNSSVINITGYISNVITVNYDANGGSGAPGSQNKYNTVDLTLSSTKPTRTGYTFVNWNTKSDGSGTSYQAGAKYTANESTTLYAIWQANTYSIAYNLNGGTNGSNAPTSGMYGSTITISNPTRVGYTFTGWTVSGTGASISGNNLTIGAGNITLTANWNVNYYYLDLNGFLDGSTSGSIKGYGTADIYINGVLVCDDCSDYYTQHPYGTTYSVSDIKTIAGHTYNGVYNSSSSGTINGSTAIYLSYSTNTYSITYNLNGGTKGSNAPTSGKYGSTITVSNPTRTNYTFTGWTVSGTGASMSGTSLTIGVGNITLTANWKANDTTPPIITLKVYKIGSYDGNNPKTKGDSITTISSDYTVGEWKNYGYWFDISTNEDSVINWTYNNEGSINGGSPSNSGANCNNSCSKTLSGNGNRKATIVATDKAGNVSKIDVNIYIDRTPPTTPVIINTNSNKWVNNDYSLTIKSKDVFSGLANIQYSTDNSNWITVANSSAAANTEKTVSSLVSTEGNYNYYVRACDNAGNCSSSYSVIKLDKTKPTITWGSNAPGEYENNAGISVNAVCTDSGSGVSKSNLGPITVSSPTNGKEITFTCTDSAGNSQTLKGTFYVKTSSADSSCGVEKYKSCKNIDCGYKTCRSSNCGVYYYVWVCCRNLAGDCSEFRQYYQPYPYKYCSISATVYNECKDSSCGYETCRTERCGIESYKVCWHY